MDPYENPAVWDVLDITTMAPSKKADHCLIKLRCGATKNDWGKIGADSLVFRLIEAGDEETELDKDAPYAELWMGTHHLLCSQHLQTGETLCKILEDDPSLLSVPISNRYRLRLPFLFKILSIRKALCIQAHPDKTLAQVLHARDPITYPDSNHKPEMVVALTPFEVLCGFRPFPEIAWFLLTAAPLRRLVGAPANECISLIQQDARDLSEEEGALKRAWEALLRASPSQIASCTKELMTLLLHDDQVTVPELHGLAKLIIRLHQQWPNDIGLFAVFFMNHVTLTPGEALFVQPNELHAYLSGDAVECMASSANVVRGGLTKKKKDIETLVSMLSYSYRPPTTPKICPLNPYVLSAKGTAFSVLYESPAEEFDIVKTELSSPDAEVHFGPIQGPSMMICLQGGGEIAAGCREDKIETGSIWFISAGNIVSLKNRKPGNLTVFQALCDSQGTGKEVAVV